MKYDVKQQQLEEEATRFLRKHGYAWNGESLVEEKKRHRELFKFRKNYEAKYASPSKEKA